MKQSSTKAVVQSADAGTVQSAPAPTTVVIYVTQHCTVCAYSYEVAAFIRRAFPHVVVRLVDLENPGEEVPETVFATPTYLLNGRLWSLGNPSTAAILQALR